MTHLFVFVEQKCQDVIGCVVSSVGGVYVETRSLVSALIGCVLSSVPGAPTGDGYLFKSLINKVQFGAGLDQMVQLCTSAAVSRK